jgi:hypothetical protein
MLDLCGTLILLSCFGVASGEKQLWAGQSLSEDGMTPLSIFFKVMSGLVYVHQPHLLAGSDGYKFSSLRQRACGPLPTTCKQLWWLRVW